MANDEIRELKEKILDLQNEGELGIGVFEMCRSIQGYSQYVPSPDRKVRKGRETLFYFEPRNLYTNRRDGMYQVFFTQDMAVLSPDGEVLMERTDALQFNYTTKSPVLDIFATNTLTLGEAPPGIYRFRITLRDRLREGAAASECLTFEVV